MKKGAGKNKGGTFERLVCKELSLWWTEGRRDDVFTRTASSGGRATQRSKKNKTTFGQYGDIQAADPIGQPLIDLCVIECKDGYASNSIADLLDREPRHRPLYEKFIEQARQSNFEAGSSFWLVIARRRGRQIMVYMCDDFRHYLKIKRLGLASSATLIDSKWNEIFCMRFEDFLDYDPEKFTK